jgi:hypothetical protein
MDATNMPCHPIASTARLCYKPVDRTPPASPHPKAHIVTTTANLLVAFAHLPPIRSGESPSLPVRRGRIQPVRLILRPVRLIAGFWFFFGAGMATKRSVGTLGEADLKGKKVFVRADLNVPLDDAQKITDDTRIRASVPTIKFLLEKGAKVVLASHLVSARSPSPYVSCVIYRFIYRDASMEGGILAC